PETNAMLRRRSSGVAQFSQHMLGKAIDFYIPGVSLEQLREAGLRAQRGGVGFYPTSGAPFVHMDTGSVRHWPRMPEAQLASVLSKGQLGSASGSDGSQRSRMPGLLARLFGVGRDEAQDAATAAASPPVKAVANARGYWQGLPSLDAADASPQVGAARTAPSATPRRAIASAVAAPWPLTDRSDNEPMNALAYAAQPTPIAAARALPAEPGASR